MTVSLDSSVQAIDIKKIEQIGDVITSVSTDSSSGNFLSLTSKTPSLTGNSWILRAFNPEDVLDGTVDAEIQSVLSETDAIAAAMNDATKNYTKKPTTTVRDYDTNGTVTCSTSTSLTAVSRAIEQGDYNKTYGSGRTAAEYKTAVEKAFEGVVSYLDDLIANYDTRVAAGLAAGHQEVKLTTLLQIRNAIRNCDLTINIEDTYGIDVDYGAYYSYRTAVWKYGDDYICEGNASDYDIIVDGQYYKYVNFDLDRHYDREMCFTSDTLDEYINDGYNDKYMLATVLHEFSHSLHIPNECIAYLMGEVIADDMNYPLNWGSSWANSAYGYGNTLDTDDEVLYFGDYWEYTSQGSVDTQANASEFANYTANPAYNKNDAKNKRFIA